MPSWKPDCLKASTTLNHINNTIQTARLLNDENLNVSNESNASRTNNCNDSNSNLKLDSPHSTKSEQSSKALSFQNASTKVSIQKGYSVVELSRLNGSQFGLTIAGGTDKDSRPRICDLKPGSIAHRCDELQIGDMIISINNIKTQGLKHEEIIDLIKNAGDSLRLEFEYNLPPWPIHPHHAVRSNSVHIQLEKENNSYGFTIRGGYSEDQIKSRPLIVTNIRAGGPSDREGTLKIGDRILAINGINVASATLQDAYFILKQCKGLTLFLIEYDSAIVDSIKNSNGPLLIEIEKSPGSSIGIKLCTGKSLGGKNQILVESVKPASIADRCGAIYVGDQILSIDDISFEHVTLAEANQILKNCVGEFSRVEILPLSQMHATKSFSHIKSYIDSVKSLADLNKDYRLADMRKFGSINSCSTPLNTNLVCHSDIVEFNLIADENGTFGFTLQGPGVIMPTISDGIQSFPLYPVVGYIEPNSPAEKSGVMQPGDRILAVNGRSLESLSLDDARQIIKETGSKLHLEIEFDVADAIMLTSGIFQVKLLKKSLELGISVAYPKFWKSENYPYISEVKKGSVAYRSGMLQHGDQILFVDNYSLRNKSLTEVNQLLKSTDEIVKLKIKKDEAFSENADDKTVVYTVEMQRNGGPLGITISGSDDIFEPMYVSGLTEGGLAERTNAIHVGDVILAINNVTLRGKSLTEAIELLQNADDSVTLKISRKLQKNCRSEEFLPSKNFKNSQPFKIQHDRNAEMAESIYNSETNSDYNKSLQFLPFPLDMTNFIRQPHHQSNSQSSIAKLKINNQYLESLKKKATSLDSINAVERELDEVLKDLELNSQDLSEQLEENEFQSNSIIELPITIQKNIKIETCSSSSNSSSSPSASLNKSNNSNNSIKWTPDSSDSYGRQVKNSEYTKDQPSELYIDDLNLNPKARQNIISTYELCTECFDDNLMMPADQTGYKNNVKYCKNKHIQNLNEYTNKSSSPISFLKENKNLPQSMMTSSSTVYNQVNPMRFSSSFSNQDLSKINRLNNSDNQNRCRSSMGQTETGNENYIRNNSIRSTNGNVISQKVFSIGPPNGSIRSGEHSPSPKSSDTRNEEKLDKLPPVPPSAWSTNSSFRRRNQSSYSSNNRLKKSNINTNNKNSFSIDVSDNFRDDNADNDLTKEGKLNAFRNNFELTIRESEEEEETTSSFCSSVKNYDNINQNEENLEDDKIEITLNKDQNQSDFGFSVTNSLHGNGIFVSRIKNATSAERNFFLKPKTKIYKVNNYDFTKIDIGQALKILSNEQVTSSCLLKLVVSNKPKNVILNEERKINQEDKLNSIQNPYAINSSRATAL